MSSSSPNASLKPTFITLGPVVIRRTAFSGIIKKDDYIELIIGDDSPYVKRINERIDEIEEDFKRLKENQML